MLPVYPSRRLGVGSRGASGRLAWALCVVSAFTGIAAARGGLINIELAPASQTVNIGDGVDVELHIESADGNSQSVGVVGAVVHWDPTALSLVGHNDNGPFGWTLSGFPSGSSGLNVDLTDGNAYYLATAAVGGPNANVTAAGLLVTTLQFTALPAATGTTQVGVVACDGSSCTGVSNTVLGGIDITGTIGAPADVTIECQTPTDCDDGNPCTDDACVSNACSNVPDDLNDPNDGLFCNGLEIACDNGDIIIQPGSVPDCDDSIPCTIDSCDEVNDVCANDPAPSSCLIAGTCYVEGTLNPGNDCEWCESVASATAWTVRPLGAACGNPQDTDCDLADTCDGAGACQTNFAALGAACDSAADTTCTDPDTCDGAGACLANNAPDMTTCDDGAFCTLTDRCSNGVCLGFADPCPLRVCDGTNGLCKGVDLEWRDVLPNPVPVSDEIQVALYVSSNNGMNQAISSVSLVMQWDPARLELLGKIDNGPYTWLLSSFPNDSALDGLNDTFMDGNALYQAVGRLAPNPAAVATTSGLLVTTFRFQAVSSGSTGVIMLPQIATTQTRIVDVDPVGLVITGSLGPPAAIQVVDCNKDADCDDGEFCNGVEHCIGSTCTPGTTPDCDDGVFCNGVETCTFGVGCESAGNPCVLPGSCDDVTDTCGGCLTPVAVAEGSRYLAVTPLPGANPIALYLKGDPNDPAVACVEGYLRPDGGTGPSPLFRTPAEWGTIHVTGCTIKPNTRYYVFADCSQQLNGLFSAPTSARTWRWGDVNGNGSVTFVDFSVVNDAAGGSFGSFTVQNLDLAPCRPDGVIDSLDVAAAQSALGGNPFPCADPCIGGQPSGACPQIPATSTWGVAILMILLAIGGTARVRHNASTRT